MTNESDSFIQEVDESLRQDRAMDWMKRFGPWLLALLVLVLAGIGGWQVWQAQSLKSAQHESDLFAAALQQATNGDLDGAKTAFEHLSARGPANYRLLARMEHAGLIEQQGDLQAALREFDAIAADAHDEEMRDSAQMRAAYLVADTQDFQAVRARAQPIIDRGGRMSYLAQELLGVEAWEAGQTDLARSTLENLRLAFDAPDSVRQRVELALAVIGPAPTSHAAAPAAASPSTPAPARQPAPGESK